MCYKIRSCPPSVHPYHLSVRIVWLTKCKPYIKINFLLSSLDNCINYSQRIKTINDCHLSHLHDTPIRYFVRRLNIRSPNEASAGIVSTPHVT
jgi:hypothetical protein